jgi:hypothetical protein
MLEREIRNLIDKQRNENRTKQKLVFSHPPLFLVVEDKNPLPNRLVSLLYDLNNDWLQIYYEFENVNYLQSHWQPHCTKINKSFISATRIGQIKRSKKKTMQGVRFTGNKPLPFNSSSTFHEGHTHTHTHKNTNVRFTPSLGSVYHSCLYDTKKRPTLFKYVPLVGYYLLLDLVISYT